MARFIVTTHRDVRQGVTHLCFERYTNKGELVDHSAVALPEVSEASLEQALKVYQTELGITLSDPKVVVWGTGKKHDVVRYSAVST